MQYKNLRERYGITVGIILVTVLGGLLRLYHIDKLSLWFDEGISTRLALMSVTEMVTSLNQDVHPPLYFFLLHFWLKCGSTNDFWIRTLSVLFGIASIPAIFLLGTLLFNRSVGLLSALFLALSPFHIQYSQEARSYALLLFLSLLLLIVFLKAVRTNRWIYWIGYVVLSVFMLYTHGIAPAYLLSFSIVFIMRGNIPLRQIIKRYIIANICVIILFLPWLHIYTKQIVHISESYWPKEPSVRDMLGILVTYTCSAGYALAGGADIFRTVAEWFKKSTIPLSVVTALVSFSFGALYVSAIKNGLTNKKREVALLFFIFLIPVLAIFIFSIAVQSIFIARVMIVSLTAVPILLSAGVVLSRKNLLWAVIVIAALLTTSISVYGYFKTFKKQDWRGAAEYFAKYHKHGDSIVLTRRAGRDLFDWYLRDDPEYASTGKIVLNRRISKSNVQTEIDAIRSGRIWLVSIESPYKDPDDPIRIWFDESLDSITKINFTKLVVCVYVKQDGAFMLK